VSSCVWKGLDDSRMEIAHVELVPDGLEATGTQIGVAYELRYELGDGVLRATVVGGPSLELELGDDDFFDLGFSPLFNSLPVRRDGLNAGGEARDYAMAWVDVPSLQVHRSEQRYEPLRPGVVRFRSGSFTADIEFDDDGLVTLYPGLAERVA
jgi:uncharacterized protein